MYVKENLFDLMADTLKYEQLTSKTLLSLSLSLSVVNDVEHCDYRFNEQCNRNNNNVEKVVK